MDTQVLQTMQTILPTLGGCFFSLRENRHGTSFDFLKSCTGKSFLLYHATDMYGKIYKFGLYTTRPFNAGCKKPMTEISKDFLVVLVWKNKYLKPLVLYLEFPPAGYCFGPFAGQSIVPSFGEHKSQMHTKLVDMNIILDLHKNYGKNGNTFGEPTTLKKLRLVNVEAYRVI